MLMLAVTDACAVQLSHFLGLGAGPLHQTFYDLALPTAVLPQQHAPELSPRSPPRERLRSHTHALAAARQVSNEAIALLRGRQDIAQTVLTAPGAHRSNTRLSLAQLYAVLPDELHASAARGFFGISATEWQLDLDQASDYDTDLADDGPGGDAAHATESVAVAVGPAEHTAQLLPGECQVTAVRLRGDGECDASARIVTSIARAQQITAVYASKGYSWSFSPQWLPRLTPLTGLQSLTLHQIDISDEAFAGVTSALQSFSQLTLLVLKADSNVEPPVETSLELFPMLRAIARATTLEHLGLQSIPLHDDFSCRPRLALGKALRRLARAGRLRALNLTGSGCMFTTDLEWDPDAYSESDPVAAGIAAHTSLTALNLSGCNVGMISTTADILYGMQAQLQGLELSSNEQLGSSRVAQLLTAAALSGLTCISLKGTSISRPWFEQAVKWPWQQLCELDLLQDLQLGGNMLGHDGAATLAPYIPKLEQLTFLDIARCGIPCACTLVREVCALPHLRLLACHQEVNDAEVFADAVRTRAPQLQLQKLKKLVWYASSDDESLFDDL